MTHIVDGVGGWYTHTNAGAPFRHTCGECGVAEKWTALRALHDHEWLLINQHKNARKETNKSKTRTRLTTA
jgi:hypothetical protein